MAQTLKNFLRSLRNQERGSTIVEFAILAPAILTAIMGVFQVGLWIQNYNAVRNLSQDAGRFASVQYQRGNKLTTAEIKDNIIARGVSNLYNLNEDRLEVRVIEQTQRIPGVDELEVNIRYTPPDWLAFVDNDVLTVEYTRPVFVVGDSAAAATP